MRSTDWQLWLVLSASCNHWRPGQMSNWAFRASRLAAARLAMGLGVGHTFAYHSPLNVTPRTLLCNLNTHVRPRRTRDPQQRSGLPRVKPVGDSLHLPAQQVRELLPTFPRGIDAIPARPPLDATTSQDQGS